MCWFRAVTLVLLYRSWTLIGACLSLVLRFRFAKQRFFIIFPLQIAKAIKHPSPREGLGGLLISDAKLLKFLHMGKHFCPYYFV